MNSSLTDQVFSSFQQVSGRTAAIAVSVPLAGLTLYKAYGMMPRSDDLNFLSLLAVLRKYRNFDFTHFLRSHREYLKRGQDTGDFVPGVCNYYKVMADVITIGSGPYWHFVPLTRGLSRMQSHDKFHHVISKHIAAVPNDNLLEFGCGYGEIGRQVANITGASVTGLTAADEEIAGGNARISRAGLAKRCRMVQGDYHNMPFENAEFDKVFGVYTLKYSSDLRKALREMARVLKPGGRFVSYEILVTDKYNPEDKQQKYYVDNISHSTCMPPLWGAQDVREAAKEAGLVSVEELDLCSVPGEMPWYNCFERTGMYTVLASKITLKIIQWAERLHLLPKSFSEFFDHCLVHPTTDFVNAGRLGIISGAVMMVWKKP